VTNIERGTAQRIHPFSLLMGGLLVVLVGGVFTFESEEPSWGYAVMGLGGVVTFVGAVALGVQIGLQAYDAARH
jgi:hypothetical protein